MSNTGIKVTNNQILIRKVTVIFLLFSGIWVGAATSFFEISLVFSVLAGIISSNLLENEFVPYSVILILVFQNLLIGTGSHLTGNLSGLTYLTQVPMVFVWTINLCLKKVDKLSKVDISFIVLMIFSLSSLAFGRGPIQAIISNLRDLSTFYFTYRIGKRFIKTEEIFARFIKKILYLGIFVVLIGIILYLGGYPLNKFLGIDEIYYAKGVTTLLNNFDGRFGSDVFGISVTRMGSIYFEPINLGYLIFSMLIISFIFFNTQKLKYINLYRLILLIGGMLTFGKGAMLLAIGVMVAGIGHKLFLKFFPRSNEMNVFRNLFILLTIIMFIGGNYYFKTFGGAVGNHFYAIQGTLDSISHRPIGFGLGVGGNASAVFTGGELDFTTGSETALLSFVYQIGVQGAIALICIFYFMSKEVLEKVQKNSQFKNRFLFYVPMILIFVSIYQANTYTPQCITLLMITLGGFVGMRDRRRKKYNG
ncbi:hypothetical protein [Streptococcus thermophilus]|nr:hypothetical protein [Streptococcus thermophilus]MCT2890851.1 hypothetical protein [Streptococcus thermophilus]MCT2940887.1 hypothetical protein [Streptococcus thermophilus]MCT2947610.1 hypothetical protein [Streptococcus thermophilus]MCT2967541.1 hypothetical protein [Streptococcus thermophilus]MCT2972465.1 hypothetical protein [Streptococcus thermophilus]